jgi:hypothetical protein
LYVRLAHFPSLNMRRVVCEAEALLFCCHDRRAPVVGRGNVSLLANLVTRHSKLVTAVVT